VEESVRKIVRKLRLAVLVSCAQLLAPLILAFGYEPTAVFSKSAFQNLVGGVASQAKCVRFSVNIALFRVCSHLSAHHKQRF
jgi:hypothetical protein